MRVSMGVSYGLVGLVLVLKILYMRMLTCRSYIVRSVVRVLFDVLRHRGVTQCYVHFLIPLSRDAIRSSVQWRSHIDHAESRDSD